MPDSRHIAGLLLRAPATAGVESAGLEVRRGRREGLLPQTQASPEASEALADDGRAGKQREKNRVRLTVIAALFVATGGCYFGLPDVDPWDKIRDARMYSGPWPVVAHPPCERWGRYWSGGPSAKVRRKLGDDEGCFAAALDAVRKYGGVIEHPEASHAFEAFGLPRPIRGKTWQVGARGDDWVCCVEQGHYGHPARKMTWLYTVGPRPPELIWGPSTETRLDEGFHSSQERANARARGIKPRKRLSAAQILATPVAFRDLLLTIAGGAR